MYHHCSLTSVQVTQLYYQILHSPSVGTEMTTALQHSVYWYTGYRRLVQQKQALWQSTQGLASIDQGLEH